MTGMVRDLEPNAEVLARAAGSGYSTATDLADWLVRELGLPFRQAHHVTGRLVGMASAKGVGLEALSLPEMQEAEPQITQAVYAVLGVANSVASRVSFGGTAPANVRAQAEGWLTRLAEPAA
jgi:argininosuccinate lyase